MGIDNNCVNFIISCGRSGTTLLLSMLGAHKEIYAHPKETFFFWEVVDKKIYNSDNLNSSCIKRRFLSNLYRTYNVRKPFLSSWQDLESIVKKYYPDIPLIFIKILEKEAESISKKARIFIEKSIVHSFNIERIIKHFPYAKFIYIVRDPRAVINSIRKPEFIFGSSNFYEVLLYWRDMTILTFKRSSLINPNSLYIVRYEDLVSNPKDNMEKICKFLGVEFEEDVLKHNSYVNRVSEIVSFEKMHRRLFSPITKDFINEWENSLSRREIEIIEYYAYDFMKKYGYKRKYKVIGREVLFFFRLKNSYRWLFLRLFRCLVFLYIRETIPVRNIRLSFRILLNKLKYKAKILLRYCKVKNIMV